MRISRSLLLVAVVSQLVVLVALPSVDAQSSRFGISANGRNDAEMHADARTRRILREFERKLDGMTDEAWEEAALAWIECRPAEKGMEIPTVYRVVGLDAGKRARVEAFGEGEERTWAVAWDRKPPKKLVLTLSDAGATTTSCALGRDLRPSRHGVFQVEGVLHCFARDLG